MARVAVLLFVCCLSVVGSWAAFLPSSAARPSLYAVWSGWSGFVNITELNSTTGQEGPVLFTSSEMSQMFPLSPAIDQRRKQLFIPLTSRTGGFVGVFDLSTPGKVVFQKPIAVPGDYYTGVQYDPVKDTVWLIAGNLDLGWPSLVSVDIATGRATNVTAFPDGSIPAIFGMGGGPVTIDLRNRELIISTMRKPNTNEVTFWLTKFNLDSHRFTQIPLTGGIYPTALATDPESETIYALFTSTSHLPTQPLSFGTVEPASGRFNIINKWNSTALLFVVGSLTAYDAASAQFYSLIGSGMGPPVALVSVSAKSGELERAPYFGKQTQPGGLFII